MNGRAANYDKFPCIAMPAPHAEHYWQGWPAVGRRLREAVAAGGWKQAVVAVECYSGVFAEEVREGLRAAMRPDLLLDSARALKPPAEVDQLVAPYLGGDDPVFGRWCEELELADFFDAAGAAALRGELTGLPAGVAVVIGPGASWLAPDADVLVYADLPRWTGQLRQRRNEVPNLGAENHALKAALKYKRAYFIDWRVCDRHKLRTMAQWDFLLDTGRPGEPRLITGEAHRVALRTASQRPFRVVPFFDPGPWGGQWMKEVCDLDRAAPNYAWCFDCVPEENSLLLGFAGGRVEIPALNVVLGEPALLLGDEVYRRFGAEFPIRFDLLDTIGGGNLSFQVHPTVEYMRAHFGLPYTQDESYYILDAVPGGCVYLGRRNGSAPAELIAALEAAQAGGAPFDDALFAGRFPARRHDHFLIPAGTLHCSGAGTMVLEISATPYLFTFKLWDWNRLGLDGQPRPLNLARGREVIQWERDEDYARAHLVNQVTALARGDGWREERTGLHASGFIESRRHWFTHPVPHPRTGGVEVLNLVEGEAAVVESPTGAFAPFVVHYAETFIVPAGAGDYVIRPEVPLAPCATVKAFVRPGGPIPTS
ncbi:MAG: class I mannose-6-phosphate isomerase [Opitutaceae bacterium]|nr:class I mannose-6-phosphate isomerase [Opitutaceae bacterium]